MPHLWLLGLLRHIVIASGMNEQLSQPRVGVGVIILDGPRVLLIRRGKPPKLGEWSLPGGRLELGESLRACAAREALEETGLSVFVRDLVDAVDLIDVAADGQIERQYALIDYWADVVGGSLQAGDDAADAAWHDLGNIGMIGMWDKTVEVIFKAAAMRDAAVAEGRTL
jgi:8-oxo-dGTP diphosphatase